MIDKFTTKFREFASNENLEDLSEESKVALFGIYLDNFGPKQSAQPSVSQPASKPKSRVRMPNRPATSKQINFINRLIRQGKLDEDTETDGLNVREASNLIDQGVRAKARPKPEPEEEEGEFTGSYAHDSGSASSSASFWE